MYRVDALRDILPEFCDQYLQSCNINLSNGARNVRKASVPFALAKYSDEELEAIRNATAHIPWSRLTTEQKEIRKWFAQVNKKALTAQRASIEAGIPLKHNEVDWDEIQQAYVQGVKDTSGKHFYPTLEYLSEKYMIHIKTIGTHCKREKWSLKRDLFRQKLRLKREEDFISELLSSGTEFDSKHLDKLETVHTILDVYFSQIQSEIQKHKSGELEDLKIDIKSMESILRILSQSHALAKDITSQGQLTREEAKKFISEFRNHETAELSRAFISGKADKRIEQIKEEMKAAEEKKSQLLRELEKDKPV